MAMSKARSTACKVACAWLLTALVVQNTFQNGVYIPVSAEEQDDIALQEWENGVTDLADRALENYVSASGNPELQATYYSTLLAVTAWKSSLEYQMQARELIAPYSDLSPDIPSGGTAFGWYKYLNEFHSGTIFIYGQNGDYQPVGNAGSIVLFSSDLFTVSAPYDFYKWNSDNTLDTYIYSVYSSSYHLYETRLKLSNNFDGDIRSLQPSALFQAVDNLSWGSVRIGAPISSVIQLEVGSLLDYISGNLISKYFLGSLDGNSYSSQVMLPATPNTPQDISDTIYNTLLPDYPALEDVYFPVGGADVPDMSGFDFPPDLPAVSFNAPEMPSQSLPEGMLSGAGFWFTQFGNLLDGLGVKYIVIIIMIAVLLLSILKF